jgi:hypothetical protein
MTAAPLPDPPGLAWLDALEAALDVAYDPDTCSPQVARDVVARVGRAKARLAAREVAYVRRVADAEVAKQSGSTSTGSLIAGDFGGNRAAGDRLVRTAKNLESATLTQQALDAGEVSLEQAEVISRAVAGLPDGLDEHTKLRVEARLIAQAKVLSLPDLRRRVLRIADLYADKQTADRDENDKLRHQEARAWAKTELWFGQARDGLVPFGGKIPQAQADLLKNQVGAIAAPRRNHLDPSTEELTHSQRLGRAFCHWIERIPTDGLPTTGGTPATLTVNIGYDSLKSQVAAATVATGTRVSASELRRIACHSGILPRVLNGKSVVLDQGRGKRLFTPAQRITLADRDGGCTRPGCDRPPSWTEAHHLDWWAADGGNTDLNRAALLCAHDHHWVHQNNLDGRLREGRVEWRINGIWQRNHRWRP